MADNFGTLNPTTDSNSDDKYLVRQNGIDYRQDREVLFAGITEFLVGMVLPDSVISSARNYAFIADGSAYSRTDYPKLWSIVSNSLMLVSQSLIDADPETYAANYGDGDGSTTFTLPNYGLRPHLAAAGAFGAVGSTVEDHIQNVEGSFSSMNIGPEASTIVTTTGAFTQSATVEGYTTGTIISGDHRSSHAYFDASLVARAGTYTEVNSSFLNFYIIHGESV